MTSVAALPADVLVDSFGVRTIFAERSGGAYGGWTNPSTVGSGDITPIVDALVDLGVRHVREGIRAASSSVVTGTSATNQKNAFIELAAAGIKVMSSFGTATGDPSIATYLDWILANFGTPTDVFEYFEGPNEPNPTGAPPTWPDDVAARVKELHTQARTVGTYSALSSIPLVNSSIQGGATPHGDFQAAAAAIGGGTAAENFLDYSNYHVYPGQANGGSDTSKPSWQIDTHNGNAQNDAPGKGVMCTESGMFDKIDPATPSFTYHPINVQNIYIPRMLLEHIYREETRHYWFEFLDDHAPSSTDKEDHFGLVAYGSTYPVKPTYTTMKYLFDLTKDPGHLGDSPTPLNLTLGSTPSDFQKILFKKNNGTYYLCMWRDVSIYNLDTDSVTSVSPATVTVGLDTAQHVVLHNPSRQEATDLGVVSSFAVNTASGVSGLRGEVIVAEIGTASAGIEVAGATAKIKLRAMTTSSVPTVLMTGGDYVETGETAQITVLVNPGSPVIGSTKPGNYWLNPTQLSGTGSRTWTVTDYTLDTDEPDVGLQTAFYKSRWFEYIGVDQDVTFSVSATSTDAYLEMFDAQDPNDYATWTPLQDGVAPFTTTPVFVPSGSSFMVRVSTSGSGSTFDATLDYATTTPVGTDTDEGNLEVDLSDVLLLETPDNLQFSLFNADDNALVTVSLSGVGELVQYQADDSGVILGASVPIPELDAGTYSLTFSGGGEASIVTLQVLEDPVPLPTVPGADDGPTLPGGVHRWILQDPAGVLDQFEFTSNPKTMADPYGARFLTADQTTAPNGQSLVWEALPRAIEWEFAGYLDSEADLTALQDYSNLRRRFFLIDHQDRVWITIFTGFDPQPKRVAATPYAHDYTVKALLYGEAP